MTPRLVALDIDGTLLGHRAPIAPVVLETVHAARRSGAHIVLATGRPVAWTAPVADLLSLDQGHHVSSNGAVTFTHSPTVLTTQTTFDPEAALVMVLEAVPDAFVALELVGRGYRVNRSFPEGELSGEIVVEALEDLVKHPVTRVTVRYPAAEPVDFVALAESLGLHATNYEVVETNWLDIAPKGVTKALGLAFVADKLGVAQGDVLAIGDGANDVEMLRWAGRGVAMGQATDAVKAAADAVTGSFDEHGAAAEIARCFDLPDLPEADLTALRR